MAALSRRGCVVAPFKVGPDFIDPGHHGRATGRTSRNLDGWMLTKAYNVASFRTHAQCADVAVVEGVMGLFDGFEGKGEAGSTAQMAKWLGLPVLLVVDAAHMARSAAALVQGFERFDPRLKFIGVVFNGIGSQRHLSYLREALSDTVRMPVLGGIHHDEGICMPERHLGLVTPQDYLLSDMSLNRMADTLEKAVDLDALLHRLPEIPIEKKPEQPAITARKTPLVRIGVAMDNAFCFYYQDNLDLLQAGGAEIVPFSPIADTCLPPGIDGLYLGGGYPELFAERLADNRSLRNQILDACVAGIPVYGECGGFMYLCREVLDPDGKCYPMVGCFPFQTRMLPRLKALGYRKITLTQDSIIGKKGETLRGHEFHYSEISHAPAAVPTVYEVSPRSGTTATPEGFRFSRSLGSYIHLHFGSRPRAAACFVRSCLESKI